MTRAQTLGLMAAQLSGISARNGGMTNSEITHYVAQADALLREAERLSPESSRVTLNPCSHDTWAGTVHGVTCTQCGAKA